MTGRGTLHRPRASGAPRRRWVRGCAAGRPPPGSCRLPLLFFVFVLIPIFVAFYTSFFKWGGFGWPDDFVGLDNFRKLADDPVFRGDLWRGLLLVVFSVAVQLPIALGTAVLLNQRMRGRAVYRAIFFAPYILSEVIACVLFGIIFLPGSGLADKLVGDLPLLGDLAYRWFADPDTALPTLFAVMTWKYFGFHMMIYLAYLQGIPSEVLEAASIDGAHRGGGSAASPCRCSARPSGSACSCPSSARSSSSTSCGSPRRAGRRTPRRRWPSPCSSSASSATRWATRARSAWPCSSSAWCSR